MNSQHLKIYRAFVFTFSCLFMVGCYDPTADKTDAGSAAAKMETEVAVAESDHIFKLDADNTEIQWTGSNSAGQTPTGFFYQLTGTAAVDAASMELKQLEFVIDMDSVKAMSESLTEKLKKKGFFEVEKFPESRFVMTGLTSPRESDPAGTTHVVVGNFQLRDVSKSISFPVELSAGDSGLKLKTEFKIDRQDYGVVYSNSVEDALIRDDVLINIKLDVN